MVNQINFIPGDTIRVHEKIKEGVKTRTQIFEGIVLGIRGRDVNRSFMVRKMVGAVGVEKIWPVNSPSIEKIEVKKHESKKLKRAKFYYLRNTK